MTRVCYWCTKPLEGDVCAACGESQPQPAYRALPDNTDKYKVKRMLDQLAFDAHQELGNLR